MSNKYKSKLSLKRWNFKEEFEILKEWEEKDIYDKVSFHERDKSKPFFSIDTPPPYPSGKWHIGAVAHYSLIDMIARIQRLRGYDVLFPWGLDRNGINIELVIEKKEKKSLFEFDRADFITRCREEITKISDDMTRIAKRIGLSPDYQDYYMTDSDEYRACTQRTFIELYEKGLVVEDYRPNNFCPGCQTTIADAEIYYEEGMTNLYYIKFQIESKELDDEDGYILVATTRPELICACQIILIHPDDDRHKKFVGKLAKLPLYDRTVPIITHPSASMEYGTGALMICSFGDQTDIVLFRELNLEPVIALDEHGLLTEVAGKYIGQTTKKAREYIVDDLEGWGLLENVEEVPHRYPICERSGDSLEIVMLKEYYIKQLEFVEDLKHMVGEMQFHPDQNKQWLLDWIERISIDWPISRRRYYHTEIPLWKCKQCGEIHLAPKGLYVQPWREDPPFATLPCRKCGNTAGYVGEEKTFDTWMDSSNSNLYTLKYSKDPEFFMMHHPCSIRPQGKDIIRTWLYYTMLKNWLLLSKKPFEHVWISGMGLDARGRKMSKSLGNIIDADEIIEKYGADVFRFWAASVCNVGEDFRIDERKIAATQKVITKIFNLCRFVSLFEDNSSDLDKFELSPLSKWILAEVNQLIRTAGKGYDEFNFKVPADSVRIFAMGKFASHFIEIAKDKAYQGDPATIASLHHVLKVILKLLSPIIPFFTYRICMDLYNIDIHDESFPELYKPDDVQDYLKYSKPLLEFNSMVWKKKNEQKISLRSPIKLEIPQELEPFSDELTNMHNITN
ncbi:MAG: valine--tRNA ligase [Promethearchaeota archaeon]